VPPPKVRRTIRVALEMPLLGRNQPRTWLADAIVRSASSSAESEVKSSNASDDYVSTEHPHAVECRERWRARWARRKMDQSVPTEEVTFSRWMTQSSRAHPRDLHHGVRNAWKHEAWAEESRSRWWQTMPKRRWRASAMPDSVTRELS